MLSYKLTFHCFAFLFIIGLTTCENESPSEKLMKYYYEKCYQETKIPDFFDRVFNNFTQFHSYLKFTLSVLPNTKGTFCRSQRKDLNSRMQDLAKDLQRCLAPKEKFLPDFISESFKEFLHFLCHNDGEYMNILYSSRNQQCKDDLETNIQSIETCFEKIFRPLSGSLTKEELCQNILVAQKCFASILEEKCPTSKGYKLLNKKFFEYISKPCSGCVAQINIFLLIFSIFLLYVFNKQ